MKKYLFFIALAVLFCSCEKEYFEAELQSTDPYTNFEYLWSECDKKYSYFTLKNVDWNEIKSEYESKLFVGMSQDSLFNVLSAMLNELKDDHVNLVSNFKTSFYGNKYLYQQNFNWRSIVDHYISPNYTITGAFKHNFLDSNQIGYIRLATFSEVINENQLNYILSKYKNTKGIILDLRENGGGKIENAYKLLRRFIGEELIVQYTRIKTGAEHNNFSNPESVSIKPYNGIKYTKKVVVLIDAGTFSAASLFALNTKAFSNITLLGNKTGGGLGMPNGGQLPNGWYYRFSVTQTLDLQQSPNQENGVTPDIEVQIDWNHLNKDEVLEEAINQF